MKITVIGLGLMGRRMAQRLADRFGRITVWNRNAGSIADIDLGRMDIAPDPLAAVREADYVITMLTDGSAVADILFRQGVATAMRGRSTVIDMSSLAPREAVAHHARLADFDVRYLDAPVSGGTAGAEAGTLAIMVGGERSAFDAALPIFDALGNPTYLGQSGSGQVAKLANQIIVGMTIGGLSEGVALAKESGLDLEAFVNSIRDGLAQSAVLEQLAPRMVQRDFTPRGRATTHLKDLRNATEYAREIDLNLPLSNTLTQLFRELVDRHGNVDHSALVLNVTRGSSNNLGARRFIGKP